MSSITQKIDLNSKNELSDEEYENLDTDTINDTEIDDDGDDEEIGNEDDDLGDDEDVEDDFEASENLENIKTDDNDIFDEDDEDIFDYDDIDTEIRKDLKVPDNERITIPRLTKYEKVRLLGTRAKQVSDGSKVFIKSNKVKTAMDIAELELEYKVIPLKIKRPLPNGRYEIWSIRELEI